MAVSQFVYLNGLKIGSVKNKGTIEFQTFLKNNTVFVTDHAGMAFKSACKFNAQPGGRVELRFKRKFI